MADEPLRVFFLDVGQGDCTFIVPPTSEVGPILFDCADAYVAERFVAAHGIENLAAVVASHLDIDHIRGLLPFLRTHFVAGRRVERLVMFPDRKAKTGQSHELRTLMSTALGWEQSPPHDGFVLKAAHRDGEGPLVLAAGADWSVELVLPWVGAVGDALVAGGPEPNRSSAVLRVARAGTSILVGGDATLSSWERLEPALRPARVVRVPHHGGDIRDGAGWGRFEDLYDAVGAELSVVSVGTNNAYRHPLDDHAAAARRGGSCRLLCTQVTPRCHDEPALLREEALAFASGVEWPYRHRAVLGHPQRRPPREVPCAGTVVAWLEADGTLGVEPAPEEDHDLLVRMDHPLCRPRASEP